VSATAAGVRRRYVDTSRGQVHLAECGTGEPVLFLHQTPRSWREYQEVLPIARRDVHAIAIDSIGFGQSAGLREPMSIELFGEVVVEVLDALGLDSTHLVGHHTGGVIAVEVAATHPERVRSLVLSATPYVDAARRERVAARPPIDHVEQDRDGGHLIQLWAHRRSYYAHGEERFMNNYVADALETIEVVEEGHRAVNAYRMEDRLPLVRSRSLLLCGALDEYSRPDLPSLQSILGCASVIIEGAGVALPEQRPAEFAAHVVDFVTSTRQFADRGVTA
jgi:pimeloyl-ACP methyl ester carboxylesterase